MTREGSKDNPLTREETQAFYKERKENEKKREEESRIKRQQEFETLKNEVQEQIIIQIRRGLTSKQLNITGWKLGEWVILEDTTKKRLIVAPDGQTYQDYLGLDMKHDLVRVDEKNKTKKVQDENKLLKKAITEKEIRLEDKESVELDLYKYIIGMGIRFTTDQFGNRVGIYNNKYYEINHDEFKYLIVEVYFEEKGKVFNNSIWEKVKSILQAKCAHDTTEFPLRCHTNGIRTYYDDGDSVWEFCMGEAKTYDKESADCPVIFRRYVQQQKAPIAFSTKKTIDLLRKVTALFQLEDYREESLLPLFLSSHPSPIQLFTGDPGAAKSTYTQFISTLVDPNNAEKLTLPAKNELEKFALHKQQFYIIQYDNVRDFCAEQSDELCRMVTGGTSIARKLFTNGELYLSKGMPRLLINGLRPEPSNFNDLLDRTLLLDMRRVNSKPEDEIWSKINEILPELRYCCLRDASLALALEIGEIDNLPRMSRYCILGEKISRVWGNEKNSFIEWFTKRMEISHASGMDDPLMIVLKDYLKANKFEVETQGMKHSASEWRIRLVEWAKEKNVTTDIYGVEKEGQTKRKGMAMLVDEKDFPKSANWIGRRFRDLAPLMETLGYGIEVLRTTDDRIVHIFKKK